MLNVWHLTASSLSTYIWSICVVSHSPGLSTRLSLSPEGSLDFVKGGSGLQESIPRQNIALKKIRGRKEFPRQLKVGYKMS